MRRTLPRTRLEQYRLVRRLLWHDGIAMLRQSLITHTMRRKQSQGRQRQYLHIDLEPLLSEVVLRKLKCDFSGKAYEGKMLKNGRAYLTNVNAQCPIGRRETYNTGILLNAGAYCKQDDEEAGGILSGEFGCSIGSFNANTYVYTYCYPNDNISDEPGNPPTRLVIEGEIDGKVCYYPINICNFSGSGCGVERNCSYAFDIILKSLGTDDPDTPVSHADVEISFGNAKNWNITDERIETY